VYQYTYYAKADALIFVQENVSKIHLGPIPVTDKNNLCSIVAVFDCGDKLLIYTLSIAKAAFLPGLKKQITASIFNRADAIISWFCTRADIAFTNKQLP
jgi:hypothetical protein